ncbi:MAG: hypothetical protein FWE86_02685 [Oscillospiraceae bacterium]|nr:hypothetical protein [Oscillospiraceae bacterium]
MRKKSMLIILVVIMVLMPTASCKKGGSDFDPTDSILSTPYGEVDRYEMDFYYSLVEGTPFNCTDEQRSTIAITLISFNLTQVRNFTWEVVDSDSEGFAGGKPITEGWVIIMDGEGEDGYAKYYVYIGSDGNIADIFRENKDGGKWIFVDGDDLDAFIINNLDEMGRPDETD